MSEVPQTTSGTTKQLSRTRGALSGGLLMLLGAWAALVPFIGPLFNFAFTPQPNTAWHWTAARGWYEVLPGGLAFLGGLLLLLSRSRVMTMVGAWLGILAGAWLVIGPPISGELRLGALGVPTGSSPGLRVFESLAYFDLLGAVILFLAAAAFGRLSVVTVRDVRVAERREAARVEAEELAAREAAERNAAAEHDTAARELPMREAEERRAAEQAAVERNEANRVAAERHTEAQPTGSQSTGPGADPNAYGQPAAAPEYSGQQDVPDTGYTDTTYGRHDGDGVPAEHNAGYPPAPPPPPPAN